MSEMILSPALVTAEQSRKDADVTRSVLAATHEWVRVAETWNTSESARKVLQAFGLGAMIAADSPTDFANAFITNPQVVAHEHYSKVVLPWRQMIVSVRPWSDLVVPQELVREEQPNDILSFTLYNSENTSLDVLYTALDCINTLYELLATYRESSVVKFQVVSIQSGSNISVSLKGSGDIVKQLKELLIEMWNKVRFKKQDEQLAVNNALISSLGIIVEIEKRSKDGSLPTEAAEKLRRGLIRNMIGLLNCHALPDDIPQSELIPNEKLLESFSPKLLAADAQSSTFS